MLKPSERDPSASLLLARAVLTRGRVCPTACSTWSTATRWRSTALLEHPRRRRRSRFVGLDADRAVHLYAPARANGKRVQALGGAKNHMVVMPDADLDMAADALMGAAYGSAGERCMAISVAVPVGDAVGRRAGRRASSRASRALKVGPGTDPRAEMGPLVTGAASRPGRAATSTRAWREGAQLVVDGRGSSAAGYENGYFVGGTLFDHVTPDMTIYRDEIFGPVLAVVRRRDLRRRRSR